MRRAPIPPKRKRGRRAPIIRKQKPKPIPLEVALEHRDVEGRNYEGPKFPCGMCNFFHIQATMRTKDKKGKPLSPMIYRKCSLHPNAPDGGNCNVEKGVAIKCRHFTMHETFFKCIKSDTRNITPRACAYHYTHKKVDKCSGVSCEDCSMGRRIVKWITWKNYNIPPKGNIIMEGMVEERI